MAEENYEDQRSYKRIPITTRLRFRKMDLPSETEHVVEKVVTNISGGGIFVPGEASYPKGALLQMEFKIPSRADKVVVMGRVTWAGASGMGVEFLKIDPRIKAEIVKNAKRGAWIDSKPEMPVVKAASVQEAPSPDDAAATEPTAPSAEEPADDAGGFAPPPPDEEPPPPQGDDALTP